MTTTTYGGRTFDAVPDYDDRNREHPAAVTVVPLARVLWPIDGPVLNQGQVGACAGYSSAAFLNAHAWLTAVAGAMLALSPEALTWYSAATRRDRIPGVYPGQDTGTTISAMGSTLRAAGRIVSWQTAFGLDHALGALQLKPIILCIPWYSDMMHPVDRSGLLSVSGYQVGWHAILARGFDPATGLVTLRQSWGAGWGAAGDATIRADALGGLLQAGGTATTYTGKLAA